MPAQVYYISRREPLNGLEPTEEGQAVGGPRESLTAGPSSGPGGALTRWHVGNVQGQSKKSSLMVLRRASLVLRRT